MNRVIFLDIDGVLNSNQWNDEHQKEIREGTLIDADKVRLLGELIRITDAYIVLHSGWRFWFDDKLKPTKDESVKLMQMLEAEGLSVFDVTPDLTTEEIRRTKKFSLVKADEILEWLSVHGDVTGWVVLDDLDLHNLTVKEHQVMIDSNVGLTPEDIHKAVKILL